MLLKQFFPDVLLILSVTWSVLVSISYLHLLLSVAVVNKRKYLLLLDPPSAHTSLLYICTKMGKLRNLVLNLFSRSLKFLMFLCLHSAMEFSHELIGNMPLVLYSNNYFRFWVFFFVFLTKKKLISAIHALRLTENRVLPLPRILIYFRPLKSASAVERTAKIYSYLLLHIVHSFPAVFHKYSWMY